MYSFVSFNTCIELFSLHHNENIENSHHLPKLSHAISLLSICVPLFQHHFLRRLSLSIKLFFCKFIRQQSTILLWIYFWTLFGIYIFAHNVLTIEALYLVI